MIYLLCLSTMPQDDCVRRMDSRLQLNDLASSVQTIENLADHSLLLLVTFLMHA